MTKAGFAAGVLVIAAATQLSSAGDLTQTTPKSTAKTTAPARKLPAAEVDGLMAPVALYPDQLLAQMLVSAGTPAQVTKLDAWLKTKPPFKGTALQDAARQSGFEPSLIALTLFPQVVDFMATNLDWTTEVGQAFTADRAAVLDSVQRLRADALKTGKLKTTEQLSVSLKTAESGQQVIVIEPANPQIVHVPKYDTSAVYSQAPTSTTVVIKEDDDDDEAAAAVAAGVIGFTAGVVIGAAMDNDYYYGPYGWHGSPYMYNDAWDDWYDDREDAREDYYEHREDAREDLYEHREDMADSRGDRASTAQEQRTERQQTREQTAGEARSARSGSAASSEAASATQAARSTGARAEGRATTGSPTTQSASAGGQSRTAGSSYQARGQDRDRASTAAERSGTGSDAFSNYSSGRSERSASARGKSSRASSRSGGGRGGRR
jgi:hypothetical protein